MQCTILFLLSSVLSVRITRWYGDMVAQLAGAVASQVVGFIAHFCVGPAHSPSVGLVVLSGFLLPSTGVH